jgi:hypothetical protein
VPLGGALGNGCLAEGFRHTASGHLRVPVHCDFAQISKDLGSAILPGSEGKELRMLFDEAGGGVRSLEYGVVDDVFQKGDVGLHAPNAELAQRTIHALAGLLEVAAPGGGLHQQGVVEGRNDRTAVSRAAVETDTETSGRAIGVDLAVIGQKLIGWVFGGDAALDGDAAQGNGFLIG